MILILPFSLFAKIVSIVYSIGFGISFLQLTKQLSLEMEFSVLSPFLTTHMNGNVYFKQHHIRVIKWVDWMPVRLWLDPMTIGWVRHTRAAPTCLLSSVWPTAAHPVSSFILSKWDGQPSFSSFWILYSRKIGKIGFIARKRTATTFPSNTIFCILKR